MRKAHSEISRRGAGLLHREWQGGQALQEHRNSRRDQEAALSGLRIQRAGNRSHHFQDHVRGRRFAEGLAGSAAGLQAALVQAEAEGQPVVEIVEAAAHGAEITAELNGEELTITAHEPETMEVAFNVTGERRKALVESVKAFVDAPAVYQNAPSFAYVIGDYTVSKTGTVSGPENEALMAALNAKGFIAE